MHNTLKKHQKHQKTDIARRFYYNGGQRRTRKNITRSLKIRYTNKSKSHLVRVFLEILNMVKLYHWKTHSYAQHKATDELYGNLNENVDRFIEVLMGKDPKRIKMIEKKIDLIDPASVRDFKSRIYEYRDFLTEMNLYFNDKTDTDLLSIRDDLLVNINQFLYLMTLGK
jgi:hypothetical protein